MTIEEFIKQVGLEMMAQQLDEPPPQEWMRDASTWSCELYRPGVDSKLTIKFHMGSAHTGPPTIEQVVDAIHSDISLLENGELDTFEDYCSNFGGNADSLSEYKRWEYMKEEVERESEGLQTVIPDDYEAFINDIELY